MDTYGAIRDKNQVKMLILVLLKGINRPLDINTISEIMLMDGIVNYFDFTAAIDEMLASSHIDVLETPSGTLYGPTPLGLEAAELFEKNLPLSVRDKVYQSAIDVLTTLRSNSELICSCQSLTDGYTATVGIKEGGSILFKVSLYCATEAQAQNIIKNFKSSPELVYQRVLSQLTGLDLP